MRDRQALGPAVALAGATIVLLISFLPWYRFDPGPGSALDAAGIEAVARDAGFATAANFWKAWGLLPDLVLLASVGGTAALVAGRLAGAASRLAPLGSLLLALSATVLVILCAIGHPGPRELVTTSATAWLALIGAAAMIAGAALWFDEAAGAGAATG